MPTKTTQRIHVYLAHSGVASRRVSETLIAEGRVKVNGKTATIGQVIDPDLDVVIVDNHPISKPEPKVYYLVNKPVHYVSTTSDELDRPTVLELLPSKIIKTRLYPVGRLDIDSEGLMLLTNDGALAQKMTHPKYGVKKTYEVLVQGQPTDKALEHLRNGVRLKDGMTQPVEVTVLRTEKNNTWLQIVIKEGRNRQIRRMLQRVGYETVQLIRTRMGEFSLDDLEGKPWMQVEVND
ncbi:MAG: pseudouridine synthase [Microgenomates group bacterium]